MGTDERRTSRGEAAPSLVHRAGSPAALFAALSLAWLGGCGADEKSPVTGAPVSVPVDTEAEAGADTEVEIVEAEFDVLKVLAKARAAIEGFQFEDARGALNKVVDSQATDAHATALVGIAECWRREGRSDLALHALSRARKALDGEFAVDDWRGYAEPEWREESVRTFIDAGLLDQAQRAWAESGIDVTTDLRGAILEIELFIATSRYAFARSSAQRALGRFEGPWQGAFEPAVQREFEMTFAALNGIATVLENADDVDNAALADELESLLGDPGFPVGYRFRMRADVVLAWRRAGRLERAFQASEELEVDAAGNPQRVAEAVEVQARVLMDGEPSDAQLEQARSRLSAKFIDALDGWKDMPLRAGGMGVLAFSDRRRVLHTLLELDRRLGSSEQAFEHLESSLSIGTLGRALGGESPALSEFRSELLGEAEGALIYSLDEAGGHVIAVDATDFVHVQVDGGRDYRRIHFALTQGLDRLPADRSEDAVAAIRRDGAELAKSLLPPEVAERVRSWRRIVLVGSQRQAAALFHQLPFDGGWLCTKRSVRNVASLALWSALVKRAPGPTAGLALSVIGDPAHSDADRERWGLSSLDLDRQDVLPDLGSRRVSVSWGPDATQGALQEAAASQVLCLLAHGVRDYERERSSGILLAAEEASSGAVFSTQVESLAGVGPLVVLAVCGAADGPMRLGDDGAAHLGGAFLKRGARAVMLSHGELAVGSTVQMLRQIFAAMDVGATPAEALRRSREQIAADPATAHPFYFAGLQLVGLDERAWR